MTETYIKQLEEKVEWLLKRVADLEGTVSDYEAENSKLDDEKWVLKEALNHSETNYENAKDKLERIARII